MSCQSRARCYLDENNEIEICGRGVDRRVMSGFGTDLYGSDDRTSTQPWWPSRTVPHMEHLYSAFPRVDTVEDAKWRVKQATHIRAIFGPSAHGGEACEQFNVIKKRAYELLG